MKQSFSKQRIKELWIISRQKGNENLSKFLLPLHPEQTQLW